MSNATYGIKLFLTNYVEMVFIRGIC